MKQPPFPKTKSNQQMKTIQESVQVFKPASHDAMFTPEIKLICRRKITICMTEGSPDDARWVIGTLLSILGGFSPANPAEVRPPISPVPAGEGIHPNANN
jgi:hypothetical protein